MATTIAAIDALKNQINSGDIETNGAYILKLIKTNKANSLPEMLELLKLKQSTITSRLSVLTELGLIYVSDETIWNDTKYSFYSFEPDEFKQAENRQRIREEKFKRLLNNLKDFEDMFSSVFTSEVIETELKYLNKIGV